MKTIILLTISLTFGFSVFSQSPIMSAKTFKCGWIDGVTFTHNIKGEWEKSSDKLPELIIDNINLGKKSARIVANVGSGDLYVFSTSIGLVFLEQTFSGYHTLLIHSVSNPKDKTLFPSFYQRNVTVLGMSESNTNFYGFCKIFG